MPDRVRILQVEIDGGDGLIVTFSDGTADAITVEELLVLRPYREPVPKADARKPPNGPARVIYRPLPPASQS